MKPWAEMTEEEKNRSAEGVLRFLDLTQSVEKLSDRELARRVVDEVWGKCVPFGSEEECLLDEMIQRFEKGIDRDEEGSVIPEKPEPDYIEIDLSVRFDGWWRKTIIGAVLFIIAVGACAKLAPIIESWR